MRTRWPFADPPNLGVITLARIMDGSNPVRLVTRDADDGGWQFLDGDAAEVPDAMIVRLSRVIERDPRLADLHDLPLGWAARRDDSGQPWLREPRGEQDDDGE